ncbi:hypothetical protein M2132_000491 [Dysgonomonas sp. PH5-45]|nr:hypothetical protein [Dysgonomonas sp. PH5-45]MDH6386980.1 hypothetical protein [Dysgonomonas sp. PH5-37]
MNNGTITSKALFLLSNNLDSTVILLERERERERERESLTRNI